MPQSRGTSITEWSDQGTEMPPLVEASVSDLEYDAYGLRGKAAWKGGRYGTSRRKEEQDDSAPLIDFEEDPAVPAVPIRVVDKMGMGMGEETKPADRLKMLLRQMEMEVIDSTPAVPRTSGQSVEEVKAEEIKTGWRSGRRLGLGGEGERRDAHVPSSPEMHGGDSELEDDGDDEIESPPTPPLRLHNPYLARRNDREWRKTPAWYPSELRNCTAVPNEGWSITI
jgi:hypothetical protein